MIEEPEAHLHPQLQLNLYNFLKQANNPPNCQLFITTHSPTLTSKADLESLVLLQKRAIRLGNCFSNREDENIVEKSNKRKVLKNIDFENRKLQLERYLDVTKSQLFFARAVLFVEGISEEILISVFAKYLKIKLEDYRVEVVNVSGVSFYPFIYLFNSKFSYKRINQTAVIITDDDRFTNSKHSEYSFKNLVRKEFQKVEILHENIYNSQINSRIGNLKSTIRKNPNKIKVLTAFKTLEYELAKANVPSTKQDFDKNMLIDFLKKNQPKKIEKILEYIAILPNDEFSTTEKEKIALLVWKALPSKAEFAQQFASELERKIDNSEDIKFNVPHYLKWAIEKITIDQ